MQKTNILYVVSNRRGWVLIRNRSMEKETLMANMGLPCEHYESDSEVKTSRHSAEIHLNR